VGERKCSEGEGMKMGERISRRETKRRGGRENFIEELGCITGGEKCPD